MALLPASRVEFSGPDSSVRGIAADYFQGGFALERRKRGAEYSNDLANVQKKGEIKQLGIPGWKYCDG